MTSGNAGHLHVRGLSRGLHNGGSPHPLTFFRMGYGPAMTPDYRPSLLRSFERHLRAENRSEHTIASYLDSLRQAEAFLAGRGRSLVDARREDLEAFLGELLQRRAPETVATRYRRLRVLYRWLEEEDEITANPMAKMKPPIIPRAARPGRTRGRPAAAAGHLRRQEFRGPPRHRPDPAASRRWTAPGRADG